MRALELKVPPVALVLLVGAGMFLVARYAPGFAWAVPGREVLSGLLFAAGVLIAVAGVLAFRRMHTTVNPTRPETSSAVVSTGI